MTSTQSDFNRQLVSSGTSFEREVGYSRAVRVGDWVIVSGTTAIQEGNVVAPGNAAEQTRFILSVIERALDEAGASFGDVVRYRTYLSDVRDWPDVGSVLSETFHDIRPANVLLGGLQLVHPDMRVEIECEAIIGSANAVV